MKKFSLILAGLMVAAGAFAADLTVDAKFDLSGKDPAGSYFSFKSPIVSLDKDQVDTVTGASKAQGTMKWNYLRPDVKGKATFPAGFQSVVKYAVASDEFVKSDVPSAWKNSDGSITIQYTHRGTAYKITTDKNGMLQFPTQDAVFRKIGYVDPKAGVVLSTDFSKDGTTATIDWAKVWDATVADGKAINGVANQKTGKITADVGMSDLYVWEGALQVTLNGTVVTIKGDLNAKSVR